MSPSGGSPSGSPNSNDSDNDTDNDSDDSDKDRRKKVKGPDESQLFSKTLNSDVCSNKCKSAKDSLDDIIIRLELFNGYLNNKRYYVSSNEIELMNLLLIYIYLNIHHYLMFY
jgi:hypothetical protein